MGENGKKSNFALLRLLFPSYHFWEGEIAHFGIHQTI